MQRLVRRSHGPKCTVMAGLVPAICVLGFEKKDVDARDEPGHDERKDRHCKEPTGRTPQGQGGGCSATRRGEKINE